MGELKQIVCLLSTMRSGSTLLKALIAEAADVSNLPEINFQQYSRRKFPDRAEARRAIELLDERSILFLKRPAWYNEANSYPRLPHVDNLKVIVLIRDVYDTVESCRKMTFSKLQKIASPIVDHRLAMNYWLPITNSLLKLSNHGELQSCLLRYEDLAANPIEETKRLFEFIGSSQKDGIDSYRKPDDFKWRWGQDDSSPNIRSLKVQPPRDQPQKNYRLLKLIGETAEIVEVRRRSGYQT